MCEFGSAGSCASVQPACTHPYGSALCTLLGRYGEWGAYALGLQLHKESHGRFAGMSTCMRVWACSFSSRMDCSASGWLCRCILELRKLEKSTSPLRVMRIARPTRAQRSSHRCRCGKEDLLSFPRSTSVILPGVCRVHGAVMGSE